MSFFPLPFLSLSLYHCVSVYINTSTRTQRETLYRKSIMQSDRFNGKRKKKRMPIDDSVPSERLKSIYACLSHMPCTATMAAAATMCAKHYFFCPSRLPSSTCFAHWHAYSFHGLTIYAVVVDFCRSYFLP